MCFCAGYESSNPTGIKPTLRGIEHGIFDGWVKNDQILLWTSSYAQTRVKLIDITCILVTIHLKVLISVFFDFAYDISFQMQVEAER